MGSRSASCGFPAWMLMATVACAGDLPELESWKVEGAPRTIRQALLLTHGKAPEQKPLAGGDVASGGLPVPYTLVRIRFLVDPPNDGDYRFAIAGDDLAQLEISEDGLPFRKRRVAWLDNYTGPYSWRDKPSQLGEVVRLAKGKPCYIEAVCLNQGGGGHVEVGWMPPGAKEVSKLPVKGASGEVIVRNYLTPESDADDDGLPDAWEREKGLAQGGEFRDGGEGDPDGDRVSNRQEYVDGTDPLKAEPKPGNVWVEAWPDRGDLVRPQIFRFGPHRLSCPAPVESLQSGWTPPAVALPVFRRLRGFVIPPATGSYRFHLVGQGKVSLDLAPSGEPADARRLILGGRIGEELAVDAPAPGLFPPSEPVTLQEGHRCYLEIQLFQTDGKPHLDFGWTRPDGVREEVPIRLVEPYGPSFEDEDHDDLPDQWEAERGLSTRSDDPKYYGIGDADGDGLSNLREWLAKTDPIKTDTDADGVNDHAEVMLLGTDPLDGVKPIGQGAVMDVASVRALTPGWSQADPKEYENHKLAEPPLPDRTKWSYSQYRGHGTLEWTIPVKQAGFHAMVLPLHPVSSSSNEEIGVRTRYWIDGKRLPDVVTYGRVMSLQRAEQLLPWLEPGDHKMRVEIDAAYLPTVTRLFWFTVVPVLPGDATEATKARLASLNCFTRGTGESRISPLSVEFSGRVAEPRSLVVAGGKSIEMQAIHGASSWAEVELPADGAALSLETTAECGGLTVKESATWVATNVLEGSSLALREGDALRLSAMPAGAPAGARATVEIEGESKTLAPGEAWVRKFTRQGIHDIKGRYDPGNGQAVQEGKMQVTVLAVSGLPSSVLARVGSATAIPALPAGLQLDGGEVARSIASEDGKSIWVSPVVPGDFRIPVRLGDGGSIVGMIDLKAFELRMADEPFFAGKNGEEALGRMVHIVPDNAPGDGTLVLECRNPDRFVPFVPTEGNLVRIPLAQLGKNGLATIHVRFLKSAYDRLKADVSLIMPDGSRY